MQKTSRRCQEIECRLSIATGALENTSALPWPLFRIFEVKEQREPHRKVIIPQAPRTLFKIWLKMEDGVSVFRVTASGNFAELLRNRVPLAQNEPRKHRLVQLLVKRELTGQKPSV